MHCVINNWAIRSFLKHVICNYRTVTNTLCSCLVFTFKVSVSEPLNEANCEIIFNMPKYTIQSVVLCTHCGIQKRDACFLFICNIL